MLVGLERANTSMAVTEKWLMMVVSPFPNAIVCRRSVSPHQSPITRTKVIALCHVCSVSGFRATAHYAELERDWHSHLQWKGNKTAVPFWLCHATAHRIALLLPLLVGANPLALVLQVGYGLIEPREGLGLQSRPQAA